MGDKMRELLQEKRGHGWHLALTLVLAVLVTAGVGGLFHQPAVAKTYQVTALTCTAEAPVGPGYAGFFVHTHNEDCFDEDGNLVCPLPEIKAHVHDETCYTTTAVQTCGLAESDGHQHTEACYTRVQGDLICEQSTEPVLDEAGNVLAEGHVHTDECFAWTEELSCGMEEGEGAHHHSESCFEYVTGLSCDKPEVILHAHSDDCYQKNEDGSIYVDEDGNTWLICGMTEVTEHVHGPECFTTYELDDEENTYFFTTETATEETDAASDSESAESDESGFIFLFPEEEEEEEPPTIPMPAQSFTGETKGVIVSVEAPEGAFPEGTTMVVSPVEMDDDTLSNVTGAVESSGEQKLVTAQAVDISFFDAEQNLIEPKLPIKVSMKSALVSESENVALVHLTEADTAETAENETPEAPATSVAKVVTDVQVVENPDEHNEIQFESDAFSVYVLVGTETIITNYITADGETYTITVTYGADAMIPAGAELKVEEISADSEEYESYRSMSEQALDENRRITFARFFDITILKDGEEVQPAAAVEVKVEKLEELQDEKTEEIKAVHFVADNSYQMINTTSTEEAVIFEADGFSVYGIVGTGTIQIEFLTGNGDTVTITVSYHDDAQIPEGAELEVTEISSGDESWNERSVRLARALSENYGNVTISDARMLSFRILVDGEEIKPASDVEVTFEYTSALNTKDMAEYYVDIEAGELRPNPEDQVTHFATVEYTDAGAVILPAETETDESGIISSKSVATCLTDFDLVFVYEYETVPAD